jgi:uncharacterized protein
MRSCVIVFGREPVAGQVKRRLASTLGEGATLAVYRALLDHALGAALASGLPVTLSLAASLTTDWRPPAGVTLAVQPEGDLGQRMAGAFAERFEAGFDAAVLFGTDIPGCGPAQLVAAARRLDHRPVVVGPASDGGYYLIGLRRPGVAIFDDVPWSSPATMAATRARLAHLGVDHDEIETLADLDSLADLRTAAADPGLPVRLRATLADALDREEDR